MFAVVGGMLCKSYKLYIIIISVYVKLLIYNMFTQLSSYIHHTIVITQRGNSWPHIPPPPSLGVFRVFPGGARVVEA